MGLISTANLRIRHILRKVLVVMHLLKDNRHMRRNLAMGNLKAIRVPHRQASIHHSRRMDSLLRNSREAMGIHLCKEDMDNLHLHRVGTDNHLLSKGDMDSRLLIKGDMDSLHLHRVAMDSRLHSRQATGNHLLSMVDMGNRLRYGFPIDDLRYTELTCIQGQSGAYPPQSYGAPQAQPAYPSPGYIPDQVAQVDVTREAEALRKVSCWVKGARGMKGANIGTRL